MEVYYTQGSIVMGGRSFELTLEHDPRCGSVELGRFDVVGVGSRVASTRTPRLDLQGRQLRSKVSLCSLQVASRGFDVLSGRLDIPTEVLMVTRHPLFEFILDGPYPLLKVTDFPSQFILYGTYLVLLGNPGMWQYVLDGL
jgi:hypothetical protein